jgi:peptidoglycan-associated lipoprotein
MRDRRIMVIVGLLVLVTAPGCVSSKLFKKNVEDTDNRMAAVENAVEGNEKKINTLEKDTSKKIDVVTQQAKNAESVGNEAMQRAAKAEKAAQGKLLWSVTLSNDDVKFSFGQAKLSTEAAAVLDDLVAKVKAYGKALYIEVEGHTDNVGDEQYNLALSEDRAMAVRNYLSQNGGIPLHAMSTIALGESKPVADNSSKDGRAANRRVVIRVLE